MLSPSQGGVVVLSSPSSSSSSRVGGFAAAAAAAAGVSGSPSSSSSSSSAVFAIRSRWQAWIWKLRMGGLKRSSYDRGKAMTAASYLLPLFVCSLGLLCLVGVLRVYDPVSTKNLKHQSNLSTFMGLVTGPRPFTHLGSLIQQLRYGLQEPRGDIASYKAQLRTEIYYLHKELALLERDLRASDFYHTGGVGGGDKSEGLAGVKSSIFVDSGSSVGGGEGLEDDDDDDRAAPGALSWLDMEGIPVRSQLEVTIPFYMYDDVEEFKSFEKQCVYGSEGRLGEGGHMGEYHFHQSLKQHRWRVMDPELALLFVVPVYIGAALDGQCGGEENGRQLILDATTALAGQSWFSRFSGNDHIFVATHWRVFWWFRDLGIDKSLDVWTKLIWGRFLSAFEESFCPLITPYSTLPAFDKFHGDASPTSASHRRPTLMEARTVSIEDYMESRPFTFFFMGRVYFEHHAGGYQTRRAMFDQLTSNFFRGPNVIATTLVPDHSSIPHCDFGPAATATPGSPAASPGATPIITAHCVTPHDDKLYTHLALRSRFHLVIRGDDWSSSRLFDAIYSASLIVVVSDGLLDKALPFPCQVDWDSFIIRIPEREFRRNATQAINRYVPNWDTAEGRADLSRRLRVLHDIIDEVSWTSPNSKVAENVLLNAARRCLPEAVLLRRDHHKRAGSPPATNTHFPLKTLTQLPCPFTDYSKGLYKPGRHGMGVLQEGWNQDD